MTCSRHAPDVNRLPGNSSISPNPATTSYNVAGKQLAEPLPDGPWFEEKEEIADRPHGVSAPNNVRTPFDLAGGTRTVSIEGYFFTPLMKSSSVMPAMVSVPRVPLAPSSMATLVMTSLLGASRMLTKS